MNTNIVPSLKYGLSLTAIVISTFVPIKTSHAQSFSFPANKNEALLQDRIASDAQVEKLLQQREQEHALRFKKLNDDEQSTIRQVNERVEQARKEEASNLAASRQRQQEALSLLDAELNSRRAASQKEQSNTLGKMESEKDTRLKSIQIEEDSVKEISTRKLETLTQNEILVVKASTLKINGLEREAQIQQDRIDVANQAYLKLTGAIATAQETLQSLNTRINDAKLEDIKQAQLLESNSKSRQAILESSLKKEKDEDAQRLSERALHVAAALNEEQKILRDSAARTVQLLANEEQEKKDSIIRIAQAEEKEKNESARRMSIVLTGETKTALDTKIKIEALVASEVSAKKESERRITQREQEIISEVQDHTGKMKVLRDQNSAQRKTLDDINANNEASVNNRLQQMLNTENERQEKVARRKQQDEKYLVDLAEKITTGTQAIKTTNKELERLAQEIELLQNEKQARKLKLCTANEAIKSKPVTANTKNISNLSQDGRALPVITVMPDETVVPIKKLN